MRMKPPGLLAAVLIVLLTGCAINKRFAAASRPLLTAEENATSGEAIEELIDQLRDISEPGEGHNPFLGGGKQFLPFTETNTAPIGIYGIDVAELSSTLVRLVKIGPRAVPHLLKHLDDARNTKYPPVHMMWSIFPDEYDYNKRTTSKAPGDVNREDSAPDEERPSEHQVTVGDLCFVTLGQIVNRYWVCVRYAPSGGMAVNSPTYSQRLCHVARDEWAELTPAEHRRRLTEDLRRPDTIDRMIGAYERLAFYYPDTVEELVLESLRMPVYDSDKAEAFVNDVLYRTDDPHQRRELLQAYIHNNGEAARDGILQRLFFDLDDEEEDAKFNPAMITPWRPVREVLMDFYGRPQTVRSSERPCPISMSNWEYAEFIDSLDHDTSQAIDMALLGILRTTTDLDITQACISRLRGHGYLREVSDYCTKALDNIAEPMTKELKAVLETVQPQGHVSEYRLPPNVTDAKNRLLSRDSQPPSEDLIRDVVTLAKFDEMEPDSSGFLSDATLGSDELYRFPRCGILMRLHCSTNNVTTYRFERVQ